MDLLKQREQFKIYKLTKDRRTILADESLQILEEFLKDYVVWVEKLYEEIVKRVNHNVGLNASVTWNPGSVADGDEEAKEVTVTGAILGDFAMASFSLDVSDLQLSADVTAADTVTCILSNSTGGAVNLAEGTLRIRVLKQ